MNGPEYAAKRHYQDPSVAERYDRERFAGWIGRITHRTESQALERAVCKYFDAPGTVLDLPCGTGRLFPVLIKHGLRVTGADISLPMIEAAQKRFASSPDVVFKTANAEELPFEDNTFDYLTCYRLMAHLPPAVRGRVLGEMIRVTRKLLVVNYHLECLSPLYLFNRAFRPKNCPAYPVNEKALRTEIGRHAGVDLCEIRRLSWYERSSCLLVLRKKH